MKLYELVAKDEDGVLSLSRSNDGFNAFEVLGLLEGVKADILEQMKGNIKPDVVKRTVVEA